MAPNMKIRPKYEDWRNKKHYMAPNMKIRPKYEDWRFYENSTAHIWRLDALYTNTQWPTYEDSLLYIWKLYGPDMKTHCLIKDLR